MAAEIRYRTRLQSLLEWRKNNTYSCIFIIIPFPSLVFLTFHWTNLSTYHWRRPSLSYIVFSTELSRNISSWVSWNIFYPPGSWSTMSPVGGWPAVSVLGSPSLSAGTLPATSSSSRPPTSSRSTRPTGTWWPPSSSNTTAMGWQSLGNVSFSLRRTLLLSWCGNQNKLLFSTENYLIFIKYYIFSKMTAVGVLV